MNLTRVARSVTVMSLLIGLIGGAVASMSLPPFGFWPLGPLGIAMFLLACEEHHVGRRSLTGFMFGLGLFVPGLWWAQHFNWYGAVALMVIESLFFAGAGAVMTPGRGRTLSAIGAITLAELLRETWPLGGLPIGGLPLGQADGPLLGIARLAGPCALMMAIVVAGAGIRILTPALAASGQGSLVATRRAAHGAALIGAVALVAVVGAWAPSGGSALGTRSVAAVQGGGRRGTSAEQVDPIAVTQAHLATTATVPRGTAITLLPEDVIGLDGPLEGSWQLDALKAQARRIGGTLIAGVTTPATSTSFNNFAVAFGPTGQIIGRVEKVHRVPFGEYIPARSLFSHLANVSGVPRDAVPGTGHEVLATPAGRIGVLISFEVFFSSRSLDAVRHGAQVLVVPTNTTSYPTAQMPAQELAAARLQAVGTGRDLLQASPTGYSALINNRGDVVTKTPLSRRMVLLGTATLRRGMTPFDRWGDWPVLLLGLLGVAMGQLRARQGRQSSSS